MARLIIAVVICSILAASSGSLRQEKHVQLEATPSLITFQYRNRTYCHGNLIEVNGTQRILASGSCAEHSSALSFTAISADETRLVRRVVVHDEFDTTTDINSIALFFVERPFNYSDKVSPIPLPAQGQQTIGDVVIGAKTKGAVGPPKQLQVPIVSNEECEAIWSQNGRIIPSTMFCAGPLDEEYCDSDASGVRPVDGSYLAGITILENNSACSNPKYLWPLVITEVSQFVDWIHDRA